MDASVIGKLVALNTKFYQTFAKSFSSTRRRLQPGVSAIARRLITGEFAPIPARLLDLGCGNGWLASHLCSQGFQGTYLGLDFSPALLEEANSEWGSGSERMSASFHLANLADPDWGASFPPEQFNGVLAFAVLHHLPGAELRLGLLKQVWPNLLPGGCFIHSEWQFLNSPRLVTHIVPWEAVGLTAGDVEAGDTLIDWRQPAHQGEQKGLRYVHHFAETELAALSEASGFRIAESFYSDGHMGNLGLYQVWRKIRDEG